MSRTRSHGVVSGLLAILLGFTALAVPLPAQEAPPEKPAAAAEKPARKGPRGRLPAYFASVVSREQREEIYEIQGRYAEQIAKLQEELAALERQRDQEVEGVLSEEQLTRVEKMRDEARARRTARAAAAEEAPAASRDDD